MSEAKYREIVARMATDTEFAQSVMADPDGFAASNGLSTEEAGRLRAVRVEAGTAAPSRLGTRLSKTGFGGAHHQSGEHHEHHEHHEEHHEHEHEHHEHEHHHEEHEHERHHEHEEHEHEHHHEHEHDHDDDDYDDDYEDDDENVTVTVTVNVNEH